jgi:putative transposase
MLPIDRKRELVDPADPYLSIVEQCYLLDLPRSTYYHLPARESDFNLEVMLELDKLYLERPARGSRSMVSSLARKEITVNRKRVQRLMSLMGIESLAPKPSLSKPIRTHHKFPYLLRKVKIDHVNQVWSTDITYIPMRKGYMYLCAVIDWYSRHVLSWTLSNTLDTDFCIDAVEQAFTNGSPEIFNTDQGSQFTSNDFISVLQAQKGVKISMDGRGRALDNVFIERFWRSLKYECIYLNCFECVPSLHKGLEDYWHFYTYERSHQSLNNQTPAEVYYAAN